MNVIYTEPTTVYLHANILHIVIWCVIMVVMAVLGLFFLASIEERFIAFGGILLILALVFLFIGIFYFVDGTTGPIKYGVTLSEGYTLEELQENYNILDQKGLLYIVKEKEED